MYILADTRLQKGLLSIKLARLSVLGRCRRHQTYLNIRCCWSRCIVHPLDLTKPLSDKSTSVVLDLAVLYVCLVNSSRPNHELVIRLSHLALLLSPNFPPLFHFQRAHRLLPVYCSGDMPLDIGFSSSTFLLKVMVPPPSHIDTLSPSPSSFVGRELCAGSSSTPACTRRLHVRGDIIWQTIVTDDVLPTRGFNQPFQIR